MANKRALSRKSSKSSTSKSRPSASKALPKRSRVSVPKKPPRKSLKRVGNKSKSQRVVKQKPSESKETVESRNSDEEEENPVVGTQLPELPPVQETPVVTPEEIAPQSSENQADSRVVGPGHSTHLSYIN